MATKTKTKKAKASKKQQSTLYYFYSVGCGFCKQVEPIVDELIGEGTEILKLDLAEKDNQGLKQELSQKYNKQCGTPWLIDAETGNQVCGARDKATIKKWVDGEDIPAPPRPTGPPPKLPFMDASEEEVNKWKEEYAKWVEENSQLPNLQTAEQILERPRPKSDPPKLPTPTATDEELDKWGEEYDVWVKENSHLPNLRAKDVMVTQLKQRREQMQQQQQQNPVAMGGGNLEQKVISLEQKLDKLMTHLGVK